LLFSGFLAHWHACLAFAFYFAVKLRELYQQACEPFAANSQLGMASPEYNFLLCVGPAFRIVAVGLFGFSKPPILS
jgi:hypothetical protein